MQNRLLHLSGSEEIILNLRSLYESYGYSRCNVGTFETYDFYARNRSALSGEEVLVFTDADGRLMALKPDVTMSILKHVQDQAPGLRKLCYDENIYRIPTGGAGFRETVQTGLECIGELDDYAIGEVLMLALKSLSRIRSNYLLNLSNLDILDGLLDGALTPETDRSPIYKAVEQKNLSGLRKAAEAAGMSPEDLQKLETLTSLYGTLRDTLPQVETLARGERMEKACRELASIRDLLEAYGLGDHLHLDFSIRGGSDYYSGLIFRGFVEGAFNPVLSGGRYDKLIRRMGKSAGGIGFAVYLDQLKQKKQPQEELTLLLYDDSVTPEQVIRRVSVLKQDGIRVRAEREIPADCCYTRLLKLNGEGVTEVE